METFTPTPARVVVPRAGSTRRNFIGIVAALLVLAGGLTLFAVWRGSSSSTLFPPIATTGSQSPALKSADFSNLSPNQSATEIAQAVNEQLQTQTLDDDSDGLSNSAEVLLYGTNPLYHDTDLDGAADGAEVAQGTNPLVKDAPLTATAQATITERQTYWGSDFALTPAQQAQSQRDQGRLAIVGKARVLLHGYYEDTGAFPTASTWPETWAVLAAHGTRGLFSSDAPVLDPVNTTPFVYQYTPGADGQSFTFTYAVEGATVQYSFTDTGTSPGTTVATPIAAPATSDYQSPLQRLLAAVVPTVHAQAGSFPLFGFAGTVYTIDGWRVDVYGDPGWAAYAATVTLARLKADFLLAAAVYLPTGFCDDVHCYCINGTTMVFTPPATPTGTPDPATPNPSLNDAPTALISGTATFLGQPMQLDGSGSSDPDGTIASYAWVVTAPDGTTANLSGALVSFPATQEGNYLARLTVTDNRGATGTSTLSVPAFNNAPVALVSISGGQNPNQEVTINGSNSFDPDERYARGPDFIASYAWQVKDPNGAVVAVQNDTAVQASFIPDIPGRYSITLTVTDSKGKSGSTVPPVPYDIGLPPFGTSPVKEVE